MNKQDLRQFDNRQNGANRTIDSVKTEQRCTRFYYQGMIKFFKPLDLTMKPSIFLLLMRKLIEISYTFNQSEQFYDKGLENAKQEKRIDSIFEYIKYSQVQYFLSEYFNEIRVDLISLILIFVINCLFILLVATKYFLFLAKKEDKSVYLNRFIRFLITIYNYGFYHISIGTSLQFTNKLNQEETFSQPIGFLNIIFTIIVGFLIEFHDFSFSFNSSTFFTKPAGISNLIILVLSTVLVFLNKYASTGICCFYAAIYFSFQLIISFYKDQFFAEITNRINFSLNLSQLMVVIFLILQMITSNNSDAVFIAAVIIPLVIKITINLRNSQYQQLLDKLFAEDQLFQCETNQFIRIIRIVQKEALNFQNFYLYQGKGIIYENILHLHQTQCKDNNGTCFCQVKIQNKNIRQDILGIEELSEQHKRKDIIQNILLQLIQDYIIQAETKKKQLDVIKLKLTLINYLHEIIKDQTKTCIEINRFFQQNIQKHQKVKGAYLFYYCQLKDSILDECNGFFIDSSIENQRINMMGAILFDEKLQICRENLRNQLHKTGIFYDYLCSDHLNLQYIQFQAKSLQNSKNEFEKLHFELYQINPFNIDLQYITSMFVQILDFENRKITDIQKQVLKNMNISKKGFKNFKEKFINQQKDYFSNDTCVIYCSLVDTQYKVKKVSTQFQKIFKIGQDKIIGKSINVLIPRVIKDSHDQMIDNFINKDSLNLISQGERFAFGVDNKGFIFPINLRFKLESSNNDIGVCALISKVQDSKHYILFNDDGKITDFSKKLFADLFQNSKFRKDFLQDIYSLIPIVQNIIECKHFDVQCCSTLIVQKNNSKDNDLKGTIASSLLKKNFQSLYSFTDDVFVIQFKVSRISTRINVNINYIEIDFFEKETHELKKKKIISEVNQNRMAQMNENNLSDKPLNIYSQQNFMEQQISQLSFEMGYRKKRVNDNEFEDDYYNSNNSTSQSPSPIKKDRRTPTRPTLIIQQQQIDNISNMIYSPYFNHNSQRVLEQSIGGSNQNLENYSPSYNSFNYLGEQTQQKIIVESPIKLKGGIILRQHIQSNQQISEIDLSRQNINQQSTYRYPLSKNSEDITLLHNNSIYSKQNLEQADYLNEESHINNIETQKQYLNEISAIQNKEIQSNVQLNMLNEENDSISFDNNVAQNFQIDQKNKVPRKSNFSNESDKNENDEKRDQRNEIASVNSSKFSSKELNKRSIIKKLKKEDISKGQYIMIYTGITAFLVLLIVTILMHQKNIQSINYYQKSFKQMDHALYLFGDVLDVLSLANYRDDIIGMPEFLEQVGPEEQIQKEVDEVQNIQFDLTRNDYRYHFYQLIFQAQEESVLNQLQNEQIEIHKYTDKQNEKGDYISKSIFQNLHYTINEFFYAISQYINAFTSVEENFIWENILTFKKQMKSLQTLVQNVAFQQFRNMENVQQFILIIISVINILLVVTIIPLSIKVQIQKENILKLVGSFQPLLLERQVKIIEFAILKLELFQKKIEVNHNNKSIDSKQFNQVKQEFPQKGGQKAISNQINQVKQMEDELLNQSGISPKQNNFVQYIPRIPNKRNRSIASFNSLQKFNWIIFLASILVVTVLLIQPFVNIIISKPYLKEQQVLIEERITLLDIASQLLENQAPHFTHFYMIYQRQKLGNEEYYYGYITKLKEPNAAQIQNIPFLQKNLEIKRFKQDRFDDFYKNILNDNLCLAKEKYSKYFSSNITRETCDTLFDGILQRGLLLSFKKAFEIFDQLYEVYSMPDQTQFLPALNSLLSKYQIIKINTFLKIINQSVKAIRNYQNIQTEEYLQQISNQFILLFILQMVIIIVVFALGWTYLFSQFNKYLLEAKNVFTLFHINILFENSLIINYIKQTQLQQFK